MLTKDTLYVGEEAREKIMRGIRRCAEAVGATMGTGGSNSLIEALQSPGFYATNDGWSILNAIHFEDELEDLGRRILLEAVNRANTQSGDGSSSTTVLLAAILQEGTTYFDTHSAMDIKRSLEACIPIIEAYIDGQKRDITVDEVAAVASISAEDEEIGDRIGEIYKQIGKDGIIHWDVSRTAEDSYTIGSGITVEGAGYLSPYMCDASESTGTQVRIKNPGIIVTRQPIKSAADFEGIAVALNSKGIKDVVVFCDDVDSAIVVPQLLQTRIQQGFRIVLVKMPVIWKDEWFEDIALASGATLVDPIAGKQLGTMTVDDVGSIGDILITKESTFLDGVRDLTVHVKQLQEGTDEQKVRAARLNTKTARYFVGAHSESALAYRRLKVEDAISAAYQALNGGIVAGGGIALLQAARALVYPPLQVELGTGTLSKPNTVGVEILKKALRAPMKRICENAGVTVDHEITNEEFDTKIPAGIDSDMLSPNTGLDTRTGELINMFEAGITDPANVVKNAARNAISVAASILTTNTIVLLPREEQVNMPQF